MARLVCACSSLTLVIALLAGCRPEPPNPEALLTARSLGTAALERGRLTEAEEQFRKIVALAPKDPFGYANLGLTYLQAGRYADAETQLRHARELDPANTDVARMIAKLYALTNRPAEARATLEQIERTDPRDPKVLYALGSLDTQSSETPSPQAEARFRQLVAVVPANLAARLQLTNVFLRRSEADSALRQLEELRRLRPEPPADARPLLESSIQLLRAGKLDDARPVFARFLHAMELTTPYQASLADVKWFDAPIAGRPVLTFQPQTLIQRRGSGILPTADSVRFLDVTAEAGLPEATTSTLGTPGLLATGDFDGDGTDEVLASVWSAAERKFVTRLYSVGRLRSRDLSSRFGAALPSNAIAAAVGDYDNDGWLDLFIIGADGHGSLLHNTGTSRFEDATPKTGIVQLHGAHKAVFADLDHDGDLDLLLVGGDRTLVYRNNLDGTFSEVARSMGFSSRATVRDATLADFDDDGRIDVVAATDAGVTLYHNTGAGRFDDATDASGLPRIGAWTRVSVADYDNDGTFDILAVRRDGAAELWRNDGTGKLAHDARSGAALGALGSLTTSRAEFADLDNDGWLDLVAVGAPRADGRGAVLLMNDGTGRFVDRSSVLPARVGSAAALLTMDVDNDGDLDLLIASPGGPRLLSNEGGNARLAMRVTLTGLRTGSGKNNDFGIGAKVELRAGELHQTRIVTGRVTHFGLGPHLKADVLRIQWPNGVPQTIYFPGTDQDVLELELLKGSCAFLYTWDGRGFRFATDVMWRSALGMPVGIMAGDDHGGTMYASAGASREYLRIPGTALRPRQGRYVVQLTEELWETAYADQLKLLTLDHPDSAQVFVDERFVPPAPVKLRLFSAVRRQPPRSAVDDQGNDVLAALREHDDRYVSNLTPTRYQGLVEPHDLIMDLGDDAGTPGSILILRGWIYPTDASINVAVSQQSTLQPMAPLLQVRATNGQWKTVIPDMGFPSGKNKTMVIDLARRFPTRDHHVRIRTNMQIYWDQAIVAHDAAASPARIDTLRPVSADLHFRGFSRTYRKGGRYGPHWFDYDYVTRESPWRRIQGSFTRFGDVLPLLRDPDDQYVIMAPGDEATIQFDASSAAAVPNGWTRDFLLYTDGWIKDADLNTAFGNTVAPLPFHAMKQYPYAPGESYPTDSAHTRFVRDYNTRMLKR